MVSAGAAASLESQAALAVDEQRLERLVREQHAFIWRLLRRIGVSAADADDVAQQVFLVASGKLDSIVPARERAFLYSVAIHIGTRALRARARRHEDPIELIAHTADGKLNAEELMQERQARALLDSVLRSMPEHLRIVFVLYEIEELTMAEISEACALPLGTVASRLRRARDDFDARVLRLEARRRSLGDAR